MKKFFMTLSAFMLIGFITHAQDYTTGIGFRGGLSNGLTVKHFTAGNTALEGFLSTRWNRFHLTGLYEIHAPAFSVAGLNWYYGAGAHLGTGNKNDNHTVIGVDGILGLEYNIGAIPFNISLDYKPALNLIGDSELWPDEFALSIRYVW